MNEYDILFNYLKNILYSPESAKLDKKDLPVEAYKLADGLEFLGECILEEIQFAKELSLGNFSTKPPDIDNVLAAPIKALQGDLRHLTWQTKQVAKGDYNQRVDFMGEFSDAFNTMISQLKERSEKIKEEKQKIEEQNYYLAKNLEFVYSMLHSSNNMIFVFSANDKRIIFESRAAESFSLTNPNGASTIINFLQNKENNPLKESEFYKFEFNQGEEKIYRIESFEIMWSNQKAYLHILEDDTERSKREDEIYKFAYIDTLTGLGNRRSAMETMHKWINEKKDFSMSFVDVDFLKFCNDKFGHDSGDKYLMLVSEKLLSLGCPVFRVGGDEFIVLSDEKKSSQISEKLSCLREDLWSNNKEPFPCSFSYASVDVPADTTVPLESYIRDADMQMYKYKCENRQSIPDKYYIDKRL